MMVLPYADAAAFDLIRAHKDDLALVMVQPVQNTVPRDDVGHVAERTGSGVPRL